MYAIVVAASPFVTSALTGWLKTLTPFTSLTDQARKPIVRALAALISIIYIALGMWTTGTYSPDLLTNAVSALIFALLGWLGSLGVFHAFFSKDTPQAAPVQQ